MSDALPEVIYRLEADLGLPKNFLLDLEQQDDWSMIIKGHSLIEAAVNRVLSESLDKPALASVIENMNLGGGRTGKLAFVEALGLLPDSLFRFVAGFAQLRNAAIHRVENVQFTFSEHVRGLSKEQTSAFVEWMRVGELAGVVRDGKTYSRRDFVLAFPKYTAWAGLVWTLVYIFLTKTSLASDKRLAAAKSRAGLGLIRQAMNPQANNTSDTDAG